MCNANGIIFGVRNFKKEEINGKKIIEVGSYNVDGSLRDIFKDWNPAEYIGVDIIDGPGVDLICRAENLLEKFGKEVFDIVISTELLEHVRNWRKAISNIKNICRPNGIILITTRSYGFGYHGYPYDFWRYELDDMKKIFSDCEILALENDKSKNSPGVFIKVKKTTNFIETELSGIKLYSIVVNKKTKEINDKEIQKFISKYKKEIILRSSWKKIIKKKIIDIIITAKALYKKYIK